MTRRDLFTRLVALLTPYIGQQSAYRRAPLVIQALDQSAFSRADDDNPDEGILDALGRIEDDMEAVPESAALLVLEGVREIYREYRKGKV